MPCYQAGNVPAGYVPIGSGSFATEADCLNACKEGACCNGTTCSVKPQCQCDAEAGEVFKGIGTVCSPNPCFPCGCGPTELQAITVQSGAAQTFASSSHVTSDVLAVVSSVLANKTFVLAYFGSVAGSNRYTDNLSLYRDKTPPGSLFLGTQSQIDSLNVGDVLWQGSAACPVPGAIVSTDVWAKVVLSGAEYIVKWGTPGFSYASCAGGSLATTNVTGSVSSANPVGTNGKLFVMTAQVSLSSSPLP